jgi:hypothetical protein
MTAAAAPCKNRRVRAGILSVVAVAAAGLLAGCPRRTADGTGGDERPPLKEPDVAAPGAEAGAGGHLDERRLDPFCEGPSIALVAAAVDARCAIAERAYTSLLAEAAERSPDGAAPPSPLRQIARRDGDRVRVTLANLGTAPVDVPLRLRAGKRELAFSVLAEDASHSVFELAPAHPELEPAAGDAAARDAAAGDASAGDVRTSRIRLPPAGVAIARLAIDLHVVKRLEPGAPPDASASASGPRPGERLPRGKYLLHIGQLVTELETGPPAHVAWEVK